MPQRPDLLERLSRMATLAAFGLCLAAFIVAPLLALSWRQQPFPGFLVESTLVVNDRRGEGWSGRDLGLAFPFAVVRLGGEAVGSAAEFRALLQHRSVGERITVFAQLPDGTLRLFPDIELTEFPAADFLALFWLPYLVGLAYLGVGVWVYLARGQERPGRALAFFCACVAIVASLLFDVLTTHVASSAWVSAVAFLGGTLISLAMRFPIEWGPVHRRPWLLAMPYLVSIGLALWGITAQWNAVDPWQYTSARSWAYRYAAIACLSFFAVMVYRAPRGREAAVRRQARLVLLGSLVAFSPAVVWFLAPVFGIPLQFNSLAILPVLLLFPLTVAVAIMRYRLLEIDDIVNRAIVYGVLTAILAGLATAAIALSQRMFITLTGERSDTAIVITTLIVAAAVAPIRNRLQSWVDRQFREVPAEELRTFGDTVAGFLELNDPELLGRRFLQETVRALGAESGAIVRLDNGRARTSATYGPWRGSALLSVSIESRDHRFGTLMIGPRRNGRRYSQSEAQAVAAVARQVAGVMRIGRVHQAPDSG